MDYWKFTWSQMGKFDIPAMLSFIKSKTGWPQKIAYIGHSMGTTDYTTASAKVSLFLALAPIVNLNHTSGPLVRTLVGGRDYFRWLVTTYELYNGLAYSEFSN